VKLKIFFLLLSIAFFIPACGETNETNETNDEAIAFLDFDSKKWSQMNLDGETISSTTNDQNPPKQWEGKRKVLNAVCGKETFDPDGNIFVFSPDGANMGLLDDSWEPSWSRDGERAVFACGTDENDNVVVVSNSEHSGSSSNWSRNGSSFLSDRMEIVVTNRSGSLVTFITDNNYGDWLPRWYPNEHVAGRKYPDNDFAGKGKVGLGIAILYDPIVIESNRGGKSGIVLLSARSTKKWYISDDFPTAQSPAWSKQGSAIAFNSGEENGFEIFLAFNTGESSIRSTGQYGFPVPWDN